MASSPGERTLSNSIMMNIGVQRQRYFENATDIISIFEFMSLYSILSVTLDYLIRITDS